MQNILIACFLSLVSVVSIAKTNATFTGRFVGSGFATEINGWDSPCSLIAINLMETANSVEISGLTVECGSLTQHSNSVRLEKKDGVLFLEGHQVGLLSDTELAANLPFGTISGMSYVLRLMKRGDSLVYKENWVEHDSESWTDVVQINGILRPE